MSRLLLFLLPILLLSPARALDGIVGEAHDLETGQLRYREHHRFVFADGRLISDQIEYRDPAGRTIGHKTVDYAPSPTLPAFHADFYEGRFVEGLRHVDGRLEMYQRKGLQGRERTRTVRPREHMAADAGFTQYLGKHFDRLRAGETLRFHFVAPSRLTTVKFDARKVGEREIEGTPVVDIRVEISSFLSLFVDPLLLSYDPDSLQVVEYRGTSDVRDADGDQYQVRIRFPDFMRKPAAAADTPP